MSSVLVCPNCRSCVPVPYPVAAGSAPCQGCHRSVSELCMAGGVVSQLPLPYVCRHWMQVAHPPPCGLHLHPCAPQLPFAFPPAWPAAEGPKQKGPPPPPLSPKGSSRGGSPEGTLILPDQLAPASSPVAAEPPRPWTPEDDMRVLAASREALDESGWYYGSLSWQEAAALLADAAEGTFLVRDSSSSQCPYALSVRTPQGPTSIRVEYERGKFWLACERKGVTPQLGGVIELVQFYKALAKENRRAAADARHVWVDHRGKVFSPIRVVQPLKRGPPSLQHLCRLAARRLPASRLAALPAPLKAFLQRYQHDL